VSAAPAWLAGKRGLIAGAGPILVEVAAALRKAGATIVEQPCGAADDAEGTLSAAEAALGGAIDLLVHGGASIGVRASEAISLEQWRAEVSTDIDSRFIQTAAMARRCISTGRPGSILYLLPSRCVAPGRLGQAAALGAVSNLVKTLAVEWARDGIRINGIASHACEDPAAAEPTVRRSLANLAAYLLSDYAAYVSGMVTGVREFSLRSAGTGDPS
jgi:NAD(P)-dependent dehydrogenase (short-subunit alcohol dehydrogenase family)